VSVICYLFSILLYEVSIHYLLSILHTTIILYYYMFFQVKQVFLFELDNIISLALMLSKKLGGGKMADWLERKSLSVSYGLNGYTKPFWHVTDLKAILFATYVSMLHLVVRRSIIKILMSIPTDYNRTSMRMERSYIHVLVNSLEVFFDFI